MQVTVCQSFPILANSNRALPFAIGLLPLRGAPPVDALKGR